MRWPLKAARFQEIAEQERALWDTIKEVFDAWCKYVWPHCGVPGKWAGLETGRDIAALTAAAEKLRWEPNDQAEFDRACRWFLDSMMGTQRDPAAFSNPSTAYIDVHNPVYRGKPILQGQLRTSFEVGIGRAVQVVGDDAPRLLGTRNADAQRRMLEDAFARLSDGARVKLADCLNGETNSVRSLLTDALNEGKSPLKTARELRMQFTHIHRYNWARLARTETSFAQNAAMQAEYLERGYRIPASETGAMIDLPPYHPHCVCGTTIIPDLGLIVPDVAATACEVCQAARIRAEIAVQNKTGMRAQPRPETQKPKANLRKPEGPTEPVNIGPIE